ncbi:hypothetical protein BKA69DRAFT_1166388 [Paraphysoderma sedebokerense]|nr:hypothetical protein BKA69DRAFT_1166388 [Paraphysoderma sedebokerense]
MGGSAGFLCQRETMCFNLWYLFLLVPFLSVPIDTSVRSIAEFYSPSNGAWTGRLILPPKNKRSPNGTVYMEVYTTPKDISINISIVNVAYDLAQQFPKDLYRRTVVDVDLDKNRKAIDKAIKRGVRPLVRLHKWDNVSPLESLAGARTWITTIADISTVDNMEVLLKSTRYDADTNTVYIADEPVEIVGRQVTLVQVVGPVDEAKSEYSVRLWNEKTNSFFGGEIRTVLFKTWKPLQPVTDALKRRYRFKPTDMHKHRLNQWGWYLFGEMGPTSQKLEIRAIEPRRITMIDNELVERYTTDINVAKKMVNSDFWKNTAQKRGKFLVWKVIGVKGSDSWELGSKGLIVSVSGGLGGSKGELQLPFRKQFNSGHLSLGISTVVICPITKFQKFEIEYFQVYASNIESIVSGRQKSHVYLGSLERGWIFNRATSDVIIRHPALDHSFSFGGIYNYKFLSKVAEELQVMMARYRTGDGTGISKLSLFTSCVQDTNLALFNTLQHFRHRIKADSKIKNFLRAHPNDTDTALFNQLSSILDSYESEIVRKASARDDWSQDFAADSIGRLEQQGGNKWDVNLFEALNRAIKARKMLVPRFLGDNLEILFAKHGASLWMMQYNHIPGLYDNTNIPMEPGFSKADVNRYPYIMMPRDTTLNPLTRTQNLENKNIAIPQDSISNESSSTPVQSICIDLLKSGLLTAYTEFFSLTHHLLHPALTVPAIANEAGDDSHASKAAIPQTELSNLKTLLADYESSSDIERMYQSLKKLGRFFENQGAAYLDKAIRYYTKGVEVAGTMNDAKNLQIEAYQNLGKALERNGEAKILLCRQQTVMLIQITQFPGQYAEALEYYLKYRQEIRDDTTVLSLLSVLQNIAKEFEKSDDFASAIKYYEMCIKELPDNHPNASQLKSETNYYLGMAYLTLGRIEFSKKHLEVCADVCKSTNNGVMYGLAQNGLATCFEREENYENAIASLREFLEFAAGSQLDIKSQLQHLRAEAYNRLGSIYCKIGNYQDAEQCFNSCFDLIRFPFGAASNEGITNSNCLSMRRAAHLSFNSGLVQLGMAKAHSIMTDLLNIVIQNDEENLRVLLEWKSGKIDEKSISQQSRGTLAAMQES